MNEQVHKFIVASETKVWKDDDIESSFLRDKNFYKVLSLIEARRFGVPVPSTYLSLGMNPEVLRSVITSWKLPLMIRMEYQRLPKKKNLGGIPLYTETALRKVASFLFENNCYPVFHPHLDRFRDIYSVGVLLEPGVREVTIEVVGKGFDASDLRLGHGFPHQLLKVDLLTSSILEESSISYDEYIEERKRRAVKCRKLLKYVKYANEEGKLLYSLDLLDAQNDNANEIQRLIPEIYMPMPGMLFRSLGEIIRLIHSKVIRNLPYSKMFVASLSYIESETWILWDIYGDWYRR